MKFILLLLLSLCITLSYGQTYINFIPKTLNGNGMISNNQIQNQQPKCYDDVFQGYGYSVLVNYCFSLDGKFSHIIESSSNGNEEEFVHKTFKDVECTGAPISSEIIKENDCLTTPILFNCYSYKFYLNAVKITIVQGFENAINSIPSNCYVNSYMKDTCDNNHIGVLEYMISGTFFYIDNDYSVSYKCDEQGNPMIQNCNESAPFCPGYVNNLLTCLPKPQNSFLSTFCS